MTPLHTLITNAPFLTPEQKAQYLARIPGLSAEGVAEITAYLAHALQLYEQEAERIDQAILEEEKQIHVHMDAQMKAAKKEIETFVQAGEQEDLETVLTQL